MDKRTLNRLGEIRNSLKKYGLDKVFGQSVKNMLKPLSEEEASEHLMDSELPEKLRLMFQDLGTTFIKLGQILSTRQDIVGAKIATELTKLQDDNPAISYEEVKKIVERELNGKIEDLFEDFTKEHLATASIGQVHEAKLKTGERVAVKIQKSGIAEKIDLDLGIMKFIAIEADKFNPKLKKLNLPGFMDEFDRTIHQEIDYYNELMNMKHIENNFKNNPDVHIPASYPEYCSSKVLTMEFIEGTKLTDIYKSSNNEFDKKHLSKVVIDSYFKQVFIDGFFHGDPHPGNLLILENNVLCYLDLGMMGIFDDEFKRNLAQLVIIFYDQDVDGLINQLIFMDILSYDIDVRPLKRDLTDLFNRYFGVELNQFDGVIESLLSIMQEYDVVIPNEVITVARGASMIESIAKELDPEIDVFACLEPIAKKLIRKSLNPKQIIKDKKSNFFLYQHMIKSLPKILTNLIHKIENEELKFKFEVERLDQITNKIVLFLFASALIIGSSLVMTIDKGPMLFDMPLFGAIGFILSFIIVIYTIIKYMIK